MEAELDVRAEETGMVRLDDRHAVLVVLQVDVPEVRVVASELLAHGVPYVLKLFYGGVEGSVRGMAVQDLVTVGGRHSKCQGHACGGHVLRAKLRNESLRSLMAVGIELQERRVMLRSVTYKGLRQEDVACEGAALLVVQGVAKQWPGDLFEAGDLLKDHGVDLHAHIGRHSGLNDA